MNLQVGRHAPPSDSRRAARGARHGAVHHRPLWNRCVTGGQTGTILFASLYVNLVPLRATGEQPRGCSGAVSARPGDSTSERAKDNSHAPAASKAGVAAQSYILVTGRRVDKRGSPTTGRGAVRVTGQRNAHHGNICFLPSLRATNLRSAVSVCAACGAACTCSPIYLQTG